MQSVFLGINHGIIKMQEEKRCFARRKAYLDVGICHCASNFRQRAMGKEGKKELFVSMHSNALLSAQ